MIDMAADPDAFLPVAGVVVVVSGEEVGILESLEGELPHSNWK